MEITEREEAVQLSRTFALILTGGFVGFSTTCSNFQVGGSAGAQPQVYQSEKAGFRLETVATGLEHPWSLAFLPDGRMLVTERQGRLRLVTADGVDPEPITGVPTAFARGQGGLLDVAVDPAFDDNRLVYLSYAALDDRDAATNVARGRLQDHALTDVEVIFESNAGGSGGRHFGSRLAFDDQARLYITHGDRGERRSAQDPTNHAGAVMRVGTDGAVPEDNPFNGQDAAQPEIFSFGHRNPQGMARNPDNGEIWTHEHGPQGGDEINILRAGANYGWPVATFGKEYGSGFDIGEGTDLPGIESPIYYWVPSIAPSGMAFYDGAAFPEWQGNLFVGSLKFALLVRLELDGDTILHEERLLEDRIGRIRDVRVGPDGLVYLLNDEPDGGVYRLAPAA